MRVRNDSPGSDRESGQRAVAARRGAGRPPPLAVGRRPADTDLLPRKLPRQARSRATFNAIVDACGQMLALNPYDALTTNCISERAGVSIGTLYEYFPNRESIVAALVESSCERLVRRMSLAMEEADGLPAFVGVELLIAAGVEALGDQRNAFKVLVRDAPFVVQLPAFRRARESLTDLCQTIRARAGARLNLPLPIADTWLISQMLFTAMFEIAVLEAPESQRASLRHELSRLTFRMALGRDPEAADVGLTIYA